MVELTCVLGVERFSVFFSGKPFASDLDSVTVPDKEGEKFTGLRTYCPECGSHPDIQVPAVRCGAL